MENTQSQPEWYYTFGRRLSAMTLLLLIVLINGLGLIVLYSIGRAHESGTGGYFIRQCVWLILGFLAMGSAWIIDFQRFKKLAWIAGGLCLVLLLLVLIPGIGLKINGARRWISLGLMNMQVSDFAKIGYIFLLASYFSALQRRANEWIRSYVIPFGIIGVFFILLLAQPDFGTAFLFALVGVTMYFLSGVNLRLLIPVGLMGVAGFAGMIFLDPIRMQRIVSFLDVEKNRADGSYQLWQGIIGFGVGGINGVGLGNGRQQFAFLPEAHTDFIFPIIGEELGLVATLAVVVAFFIVFYLVWHQMKKAPNQFQFLLISGALFFIIFQAMINMGVATGCLPTKGMSLPFVSYGGSNLVANYFLLGMILRCLWKWNDPPRIQPREIEF